MDPQKLSQLDPKLREAYQRVMGTAIPNLQAAPAQSSVPTSAPISQPTPDPISIPVEPIPALTSQPIPEPILQPQVQPEPIVAPSAEPQLTPVVSEPIVEPMPTINPQSAAPIQEAYNFVQLNSEAPTQAEAPASPQNFMAPTPQADSSLAQAQPVILKKKSGILIPTMIAITGLVFLAVYTLFWARIFHLSLTFLS